MHDVLITALVLAAWGVALGAILTIGWLAMEVPEWGVPLGVLALIAFHEFV
jgi:hypothetical protein